MDASPLRGGGGGGGGGPDAAETPPAGDAQARTPAASPRRAGGIGGDDEEQYDDDGTSVADTDIGSSVAMDDDAQSSMTVTGATASHLKRELSLAMEGKRTIRRLSVMMHAGDCEQVRAQHPPRAMMRQPPAR